MATCPSLNPLCPLAFNALIWCGQDGWVNLFAVIDHCDREIVGYRLCRDSYAKRAREALNEAVTYRFQGPALCGRLW